MSHVHTCIQMVIVSTSPSFTGVCVVTVKRESSDSSDDNTAAKKHKRKHKKHSKQVMD